MPRFEQPLTRRVIVNFKKTELSVSKLDIRLIGKNLWLISPVKSSPRHRNLYPFWLWISFLGFCRPCSRPKLARKEHAFVERNQRKIGTFGCLKRRKTCSRKANWVFTKIIPDRRLNAESGCPAFQIYYLKRFMVVNILQRLRTVKGTFSRVWWESQTRRLFSRWSWCSFSYIHESAPLICVSIQLTIG